MNFKNNNMNTLHHEYALTSAVIATYLGIKRIKLGNEGIILHYNIINDIIEAFIDKFPVGFNWEEFYISGGECWDVEIEKFTGTYIKEKEIFVDREYFIKEPKKKYFLFGYHASRSYHRNGNVDEIISSDIDHHSLSVNINSENAVDIILESYDGWDEYTEITEEEYEKLNN